MKRTIQRASVVALLALATAPGWGCNGAETVPVKPSGPPPEAQQAPPPIAGGTLTVTRDGAFAIAADAGADSVVIVNLATDKVVREVSLEPGDEPGRVAEGADGQVHVALRRGGAVATINLATGEVVRRNACPAPRGLAYDAERGELYVACAGGELVTFGNDLDAAPLRMLRLQRDLRDVVISGDRLLVSRFRSAEVLVVDAGGTVQRTLKPSAYTSPINQRPFEPAVAYRMQTLPGGGVAVVHQRGFSGEIPPALRPSPDRATTGASVTR